MQLSIALLGAFSAELAAVAVFSLPLLCYDVFTNFQFITQFLCGYAVYCRKCFALLCQMLCVIELFAYFML